MNTSEWLLILIALVGAVVNYLQQREQNQIFREQNQIFAAQGKKKIMLPEKPRLILLKRYWPTLITVLLFVLIGYDIYDRHHSDGTLYDFDDKRSFSLVSTYSVAPFECQMIAHGDGLINYKEDYKVAFACLYWDQTGSVLDAPTIQVSSLYDITDGDIPMRLTMPKSFIDYLNSKPIHYVTFALLLIPKGIESTQFSTLRQARNLKVRILAVPSTGR